MNLSVVLAVVLGLALVGAVVALVLTERRNRPAPAPAPSAAVLGREALDVIDVGLRRLAAECAHAGRALPDVYAVAYSEDRLKVLLSGADPDAPPPWSTDDKESESWSVAADRLQQFQTGSGPRPDADAGLPYALVVTVGMDGGERVLVDLSRASGTIAVTGDEADVRSLVRAVVTEVITGPVGQLAEVTLVGSVATEELAGADVPRSARLHTVATLHEALRAPGAAGAHAPAASDVTQIFRLIEGRSQITDVAGLVPRLFVLDAARLSEEQEAVRQLAPTDALLVVGDTPGGWRLRVGADGSLDTGPLGLHIDTHAGAMP